MKAVIKTYNADDYVNLECDRADVDRDSEYIFVIKNEVVIAMVPFTEIRLFYVKE